MSASKMHDEELEIDATLVRRLLAAQFPRWADLPIERARSAGTDNAIFRLGDDLALRLPRVSWATDQVDLESEWLPRLAPHLPLALPVPLAKGAPSAEYPWQWAICRWLEGEEAAMNRLADPEQAARDLAGFILALRQIDPSGGPRPEPGRRGSPLATRDEETREAIASLRGMYDTDELIAAWDASLQASVWDGPPVWLHGDLQSGNLLAHQGRLSAVIDFGCLGVGDPACDHQAAWNFFSAAHREAFRAALRDDDATWARGRGWALSVAVIALPYYLHTSPEIVARSRFTIAEVLADFRRGA